MIKVRIEKVKGLSFKGYIETADLNIDQLQTLGFTANYEYSVPLTVDVEGDFSVGKWDRNDDPAIIDISCYAFNGINDLELDADNADMDDLLEQIIENADLDYLDRNASFEECVDMDVE